MQLEGVHRQLPRGIPLAQRAPQSEPRTRLQRLHHPAVPLPLTASLTHPRPRKREISRAPLQASRRRHGGRILLDLPQLDAQLLSRQRLAQHRPPHRTRDLRGHLRVVLPPRPRPNRARDHPLQRRDSGRRRTHLRSRSPQSQVPVLRPWALQRQARARPAPLAYSLRPSHATLSSSTKKKARGITADPQLRPTNSYPPRSIFDGQELGTGCAGVLGTFTFGWLV